MAKVEVVEGTPELTITKEIDHDLALKFRKKLARAMAEGASEVDVLISSPGGQVYGSLIIFDTISEARANGVTVNTRVLGRAASGGSLIFQAGSTRVMGRNAWLMFHELSGGAWGEMNALTERVDYYKRQNKQLMKVWSARSKLSAAEFQKKVHKFDWWLDAAEAVRLGFADRIEG